MQHTVGTYLTQEGLGRYREEIKKINSPEALQYWFRSLPDEMKDHEQIIELLKARRKEL